MCLHMHRVTARVSLVVSRNLLVEAIARCNRECDIDPGRDVALVVDIVGDTPERLPQAAVCGHRLGQDQSNRIQVRRIIIDRVISRPQPLVDAGLRAIDEVLVQLLDQLGRQPVRFSVDEPDELGASGKRGEVPTRQERELGAQIAERQHLGLGIEYATTVCDRVEADTEAAPVRLLATLADERSSAALAREVWPQPAIASAPPAASSAPPRRTALELPIVTPRWIRANHATPAKHTTLAT